MNTIIKNIITDGHRWKCMLHENGGGIQRFLRGKNAVNGKLREPELFYILKQEVKPGMVIMDLGANLGYLTLWFAGIVGDKGSVYAVEPDPNNYYLLSQNIRLNGLDSIVDAKMIGISNKTGEETFYPGEEECNLGSITKHNKSSGKSIQIKVDTLTNYLREKNKLPDLIKMDVEGHEVEILDGGYELFGFREFPCKIVMELHPTLYSSSQEMERQLRRYFSLGFKIKYVVSAGVPVPDLFHKWGYNNPVATFRGKRGVFTGFSVEHAIQACCRENKQWMPGKKRYSPKIARYLMIERL